MGGLVTLLLPERTNVISKIRTSLGESIFVPYHMSLKRPLGGQGPAESLSVSLQPLVMSFCMPHIYYMDTLTVHSLTHVTLYLPNFEHELSIRLQTLAL